MSLGSKLKTIDIKAQAPTVFYGAAGILFLVLLPLANFPPHIGLIGISSLITAYSLLKKTFWATWLVVAMFFVNTTFSMYTLAYVLFRDWIMSISMIAYAVLTWAFTAYTLSKRKPAET